MGSGLVGQGRVCLGAFALFGLGCGSGSVEGAEDEAVLAPAALPPQSASGASADWHVQVRERVEATKYRFAAEGAGFRAENVAERLASRFDAKGAHISTEAEADQGAAEEVTLRLAAWGRLGSERDVGVAAPTLGECSSAARVDDQGECLKRLEFVHGTAVEWWENTLSGLQQGFTLATKPSGTGRVRLLVDVGGATAVVSAGNVITLEREGGTSLSYDELAIFDADNNPLAGQLEIEDGRIAIVFDDSAARYPVVVDPIVAATWSVTPTINSARYGGDVAGVGDVNGDGFDDMVVSAHDEGSLNGKVYAYYGRAGGPLTAASWSRAGTLQGRFGWSVAGAGDVNCDGYSDVVIGEPYAGNGKAYVYYGSAAGLTDSRKVITGTRANGLFGYSVAGAGDVNGDRCSDVVVGAPKATRTLTQEGEFYLYLGAAAGISGTFSYSDFGGRAFMGFGHSVAGIGSFDGNSLSDVVVGSPYYEGKGAIWTYRGQASAAGLVYMWGDAGSQSSEAFGDSVAPAGDMNGDGFADFVVGAPYAADSYTTFDPFAGEVVVVVENAGRIDTYSGSAGFSKSAAEEDQWSFTDQFAGRGLKGAGDVNGDGFGDFTRAGGGTFVPGVEFGSSGGEHWVEGGARITEAQTVAIAGDVNGDGFADVLFGKPTVDANKRGYAGLYEGRGPIFLEHFDPDMVGAVANDQFGTVVTDVGDVNGDGFSDLMVGAYQFDDAQPGAGKVYLYLGSRDGLGNGADWTASGGQVNAHLGWTMAGGDFNGDGFNDVAIAAADYDNGQTDEGRVVIYPGSATGLGAALPPLEINQVGARFGYAIATGDVNGDGYFDLAVAAVLYDGGQTDEGRVFVYHGSASGLPTTASSGFEKDVAGAWFGSALAIGDLTGDGRGDLVVGAKMYSNGHSKEGHVYEFHGSTTGLTATAWGPEFDAVDARVGSTLSLESDVNGDGLADLAVGAPKYSNGNTNEGRVFVYHGAAAGLGSATWFVEGNADAIALGTALAGGDVNADGYGDLALAKPYGSSPQINIYTGGPNGLTNTITRTLPRSDSAESLLGQTVTMTGDFNADGFSDLAAQVQLGSSGRARVWRLEERGANPRIRRPGTTTPIVPGGKSTTTGADFRIQLKSPYGHSVRYKVAVEVKKRGTAFDGTGLVKSASWLSASSADVAVTGLTAKTAYRYRMRVEYEPLLGYGATHSRWYYGGTKGLTGGVHFRTP